MSPASNGAFDPKVMLIFDTAGHIGLILLWQKESTEVVLFLWSFFSFSSHHDMITPSVNSFISQRKQLSALNVIFLTCILADKYIQMLPLFQWWQNGFGSWITESTKSSFVCPSHLLLGEYYCCRLGWNYTFYELNLRKTGRLVQYV